MEKRKKLTASMEDYLEAVDALRKKKGIARVRDISALLGVKNSSVNAAVGVLANKGFVVHERYGYVDLTPAGEEIAREVQSRHDTLIKFLTNILHVDHKTASIDACRMEHAMGPQTFAKLKQFVRLHKRR